MNKNFSRDTMYQGAVGLQKEERGTQVTDDPDSLFCQ